MSGDTALDGMEEGVLEELAEEEEPEEKENRQGILCLQKKRFSALPEAVLRSRPGRRGERRRRLPPGGRQNKGKIRPSEERAGGGDANRSRGRSRRKGSVPPESLRRASKDIQSDEPSVRKVRAGGRDRENAVLEEGRRRWQPERQPPSS